MKISGPDSTQKAGGVKKAGKAGSTSGASFGSLIETGESEAPAHAAATGVIAGIDSLLAAQETDDPAQRAAKKRMRERGETVLKQLDKIRLGMLTGTLSVGNLLDVADVVASHRERINDPQLSSLLDEIDLRAQIEIAKMRMALDAAKVF
ncbi:MAG: flagellar assembly protein FliX [Alphaproteobacteria bacterium RIFCSPHIGHO2_12_FULL_45_9]|nr:MAG: flagellar assembly protein FliX [Alphaproteobacteria bacterium RIFCSPHIGHO2_02_FULL_46_13]OFW95896.1 MAG: flagellar assembly protein FliX [Alphaproteobacteria bacterium RIFCSPHIGHO2_12_FULL_45_9]